jgi:hypothetical protein
VPTGTLALGTEKECAKSVGKVNHTLRVKLTHPYIGVCENNCLREMRRVIRRRLEDTCTISDAQRRAPESGGR